MNWVHPRMSVPGCNKISAVFDFRFSGSTPRKDVASFQTRPMNPFRSSPLLRVVVLAVFFPFATFNLSAGQIPPPPPRVVSMSPNVTEIILALGASHRLVGVSDYCALPPGLALPRCGGALNPNFERLLVLRPNLIFVLGKMERVQQFAEEHDMRVLPLGVDSFADLGRAITRVGGELGIPGRAADLNARLKKRLERVREQAERLPKFRCLILVNRARGSLKRMMSVGGVSYLSEMLRAAGGVNVFDEQKQPYFTASQESIVSLRPDVIFELEPGIKWDDLQKRQFRDDWNAEPAIPAVERGRIAVSTDEFLVIPGPRMVEAAEWFQARLRQFAEEKPR